jgi:tripartite-type tricarboxylate transporter receptor subunit TctC
MARLAEATAAALADPVLRGRLAELGLAPRPAAPPAEVKAAVHAEIGRWAAVIQRTGMERQ